MLLGLCDFRVWVSGMQIISAWLQCASTHNAQDSKYQDLLEDLQDLGPRGRLLIAASGLQLGGVLGRACGQISF